MVGELRKERQRADTRIAASDHAEIERGDCEPGERPVPGAADAPSRECKRPAERDDEVNRHRRCEQDSPARLPRQQDRSGGECRLERVASRRERMRS